MKTSEQINELAAALSQFQSEMKTVAYNSKNPFLGNKYADLPGLVEASRELLGKYNLSVSQVLTNDGVCTILMHNSGQWISGTMQIEQVDSKGLTKAQTMGVAITYTRRYSYASILGLVTDDDTDGQNNTKPKNSDKPELLITDTANFEKVKKALQSGYKLSDIEKKWTIPTETLLALEIKVG